MRFPVRAGGCLASILDIPGTRNLADSHFELVKREKWLSDMDSNHDKSLQRALCYRYTIGHAHANLTVPSPTANPIIVEDIVSLES
jgi:hypothetical protein